MTDPAVTWLRALARRNCPACGATFGHASECEFDTAKMKAPVEWPEDKMREFHRYLDANPIPPGSFEALRKSVVTFLWENYSGDHLWAMR